MNLYNILCAINNFVAWDPSDIFYYSIFEWKDYKSPDYVFGCKITGTIETHHEYTKLGQWFEDGPDVCHFLSNYLTILLHVHQ